MTEATGMKLPAGLARPALELAGEGIAVLDGAATEAPIVWLNTALARMTGTSSEDLLGSPLRVLCAADREQPGLAELQAGLAGEFGCSVLLRCYRPDGEMYWCRLRLEPYRSGNGRRWWLVFARDVSAQREMELLLGRREEQASAARALDESEASDRLTGLQTGRSFELALELAWFSCARDRRSLALFLFAPDYFDVYLETFGRETADSCLRMMAHAIAAGFRRGNDVAARLGDAQFAALGVDMPAEVLEDHAKRICERVRGLAIRNPRAPRVHDLTLSAVAMRVEPGRGSQWRGVLEQAGATLAAAQAAGVDQVLVQDYGSAADSDSGADPVPGE
jgi:diguanylate cyclase (GGDEF)-like protein/PAS domain S-box-containing protein